MEDQLRPIVVVALILGVVAFFGGIIWTGVANLSTEGAPDIPTFVTQSTISLGAILGTFFGAVFGIARYMALKGGGKLSGETRPPSLWQVSRWGGAAPVSSRQTDESITGGLAKDRLSPFQVACAYLYFLGLLTAVTFYGLDKFSSEAAELLRTMSSTLLGVIVGLFAVRLNVTKTN